MPDPILNKRGEPITYTRDKYESVGFNAELADEVLAIIAAMPQRWNQGLWAESKSCPAEDKDILEEAWSCGTAMCFAGWAVAIGHDLEWYQPYEGEACEAVPAGEAEVFTDNWGDRYVNGMSIFEAAAYLLGISDTDAEALFDGCNDLEDLQRLVANFKRKYGVAS